MRITIAAIASLFCLTATGQIKPGVSISGIHPDQVLYNPKPFGPTFETSAGESGVGAVVPWAGKLWAITYSAHHAFGGGDRLYELDNNLNMTIRPESIGGTHANRMIHKESNQLIIGPYFIDVKGNVRSVPSSAMPGRLTGTARHLTDPANKVYFFTMEEGLYEVNVHTLDVKTFHLDGNVTNVPPGVPERADLHGYHGKGAYSGQGKLFVSNNGVKTWNTAVKSGVLAEWDGKNWKELEQKQFVEITGPGDIYGNTTTKDPVWASGWDQRSVIIKLLENGKWYNYRLPKASFAYDGLHGWYTEWPRIRKINDNRRLMTMHGMFWNFPGTFSTTNSAGIKPLSSYLKIVPDFAYWNGRIVMGTDDASTFGNPLVGRSQSNLWYVDTAQLDKFGPRNGYGAVWMNDDVAKGEYSDPFLVAGLDKKVIHFTHGTDKVAHFIIEKDIEGNGTWKAQSTVTLAPGAYVSAVLQNDFKATWIRIKSTTNARKVIVYFGLTQKDDRKAEETPSAFASIPFIKNEPSFTYGLIRAGRGDDLKLEYAAYNVDANGTTRPLGYYEVGAGMKFTKVNNDTMATWLNNNIGIKSADFTADQASVILTDAKGNRYRLPKGPSGYDELLQNNMLRGIREAVTERHLLNCYGTFYELPREVSSAGIAGIKPIATHNRVIYDFCSWRGLMVMSGNLADAPANPNYFKSDDGNTGLWFGTIDDLWKLGKPHGKGGPWKNTPVASGVASDPYLMTGYDKKSVSLKHTSGEEINFTIEVDITGKGDWKKYRDIKVGPRHHHTFHFPDGYTAHWVRLKADRNCTATAQFEYK